MSPEWEQLRDSVAACKACGLCATRTNTVFGVGNPGAGVMLVGEGPGENEDLQGEPFVGRAGILLDKMLLGAGFSRGENVYIANVVKCRPPGNRDPEPAEIQACIGYLRAQVRLIRPKAIVCLGRVAAQAIIGPDFRVMKHHGQLELRNGIWYMGTWHPAALLRYPANKAAAFADLLTLRDKMVELGEANDSW
jgi:DNA polymerase